LTGTLLSDLKSPRFYSRSDKIYFKNLGEDTKKMEKEDQLILQSPTKFISHNVESEKFSSKIEEGIISPVSLAF
jgi:hypothetical protein